MSSRFAGSVALALAIGCGPSVVVEGAGTTLESSGTSTGDVPVPVDDGDATSGAPITDGFDEGNPSLPTDATNTIDSEGECVPAVATASAYVAAVDIVIAVDNSGSMAIEAELVAASLSGLSLGRGIDPHVVLISGYPEDVAAGICVEPPLGAGGCPTMDTNEPTFLHVDDPVGSNEAFERILAGAPAYMVDPWWRPEATKHVIVVSDDDAAMTAMEFDQAFRGLDPSHEDYLFHAIASPEDPVLACIAQTECCPIMPIPAAIGQQYLDLVQLRAGLFGSICEQPFEPFFDELVQSIVDDELAPCMFAIPPPPDGGAFDPAALNVAIEHGGGITLDVGHVENVSDCSIVEHGWFYAEPESPTAIVLCPATCELVETLEAPSVEIAFHCPSVPAPPRR